MPHASSPEASAASAASAAFAPRNRFASGSDNALRQAVARAHRLAEPLALAPLLPQARVSEMMQARVEATALRLTRGLRAHKTASFQADLVQGMLQEFSLSSEEGIALMCLAEALLRIPDVETRDALIRDKLSSGHWQAHLGQSPRLFVNAATWGLLATGKLLQEPREDSLVAALQRLATKGAEPLVRAAMDRVVRLLARQFVAGQTIDEALAQSQAREMQGFRHSYDMLGEAALTEEDAHKYLAAYVKAIHTIGRACAGRGILEGAGVSIKLSALHPRYERAQYERVVAELYPRLLRLALEARRYDIAIHIDAEESERLELSLDLLEKLCLEPALEGWGGIGFVLQAYQKRCASAIDWVLDLAQRSQRRLLLRLVKGAYWDSEIKRAQAEGLSEYPVFTRKVHTDVSYIACARRLLAAPDRVYPQFATHNAHTLATVYHLAAIEYPDAEYEFQCLYGMGEPLYEQVLGSVASGKMGRACRIYAPVGSHANLLPYLVRRLLENGANSSFVHQTADPAVPLQTLVASPVALVDAAAQQEGQFGMPHPKIPLPGQLYGAVRRNSLGLDLADEPTLQALAAELAAVQGQPWKAEALSVPGAVPGAVTSSTPRLLHNPAQHSDVVGHVTEADAAQVAAALEQASAGFAAWSQVEPSARAQCLLRAADALEGRTMQFMGLLVREGGKTVANALGEVREAVDFLRYYGMQVARDFNNATHVPLGPVVCISPWNFPLAIFTGQIAAALAAGNAVLAKPAAQTPLVAAQAVQLLHGAGVPAQALQLLPGAGSTVGAALVADARVAGVVFTGSTEVARALHQTLAQRLRPDGHPVVLIAETGGQNAMVVDSSALMEQVVPDVLVSAFGSAGQRCSAVRVLCVQEDCAERLLHMLDGAMQQLRVGDPKLLATDVGPVIDARAQAALTQHIADFRARGYAVRQLALPEALARQGSFVPPTVIEIERMADLEREVFGPVLHVLRYARAHFDDLLAQINHTGYGLTQGLHTRLDSTVAETVAACRAGNLYINRNTVGAVVGVQPFGGEGLSGTGPKAGGPLYLRRLLARHPADAQELVRRDALQQEPRPPNTARQALKALQHWAASQEGGGLQQLALRCALYDGSSPVDTSALLPGPTGERNSYSLFARPSILCLAPGPDGLLFQLAAVLAVGGRAIWPAQYADLHGRLPAQVTAHLVLASDWEQTLADNRLHADTALHAGSIESLRQLQHCLQGRSGPLVLVTQLESDDALVPLERLVLERVVSTNTAAAGGNATLMMLSDLQAADVKGG